MTRKDLNRLEHLSNEMEDLLILMARSTVTISVKAPDGMPFSNTGAKSNPTEAYAMRAYEQHDRFMSLYHQIADIINTEPDTMMQGILVMKFVELLSWNKIAKRFKKSKSFVWKYFEKHIQKY